VKLLVHAMDWSACWVILMSASILTLCGSVSGTPPPGKYLIDQVVSMISTIDGILGGSCFVMIIRTTLIRLWPCIIIEMSSTLG
jgi:hypothetical protein